MRYGAILLPGIITPAQVAYGDLRAALADAGEIVLKDLAIYDGKAAPADYSLDLEVAAILKTADSTGFERSTWLAIPPAAPYRPL